MISVVLDDLAADKEEEAPLWVRKDRDSQSQTVVSAEVPLEQKDHPLVVEHSQLRACRNAQTTVG